MTDHGTQLVARLAAWWSSDPRPSTLATSAPCEACASKHAVSVELHRIEQGRRVAEERRQDCVHATAVAWYYREARDDQ